MQPMCEYAGRVVRIDDGLLAIELLSVVSGKPIWKLGVVVRTAFAAPCETGQLLHLKVYNFGRIEYERINV